MNTTPTVPIVITDWANVSPPKNPNAYCELIGVPTLAVGRFTAPPGHEDHQQPHTEDEIYFVVAGNAHLIVGTETHAVQAGSIAYVPAGVDHRFTQISDSLEVLVVFARRMELLGRSS